MKKVYLSDAGPKVSPAIYGFWRWEKEDKKIDEIVHFCLDKGINTFDHSDRYGQYTAEKSFGELLAKKSTNTKQLHLNWQIWLLKLRQRVCCVLRRRG